MARLGAGFLTRKQRADRIHTPHTHACPKGIAHILHTILYPDMSTLSCL